MPKFPADRRNGAMRPPTIALMVTADTSVAFYEGFAAHLRDAGWQVHIISSPGKNLRRIAEEEGATTHPLPMRRGIAPLADVVSVVRAARLLRMVEPDILSAGTPKAGLIGMLGALASPSTIRVYHVHGVRLETATGISRTLLSMSERLASSIAHHVLAVSPSVARRLVNLRLARAEKVSVAGRGSANGVDTEKFRPSSRSPAAVAARPTLGFVGRVNEDKGLRLLAESLGVLRGQGISGRLIVVGPDDGPESAELRHLLDSTGWDVTHTGSVADVGPYYRKMDILCLPTKREGFPTTILEASSCGLPVVATAATGVVDALVDGETGRVVKSRDPHRFADAIAELLSDEVMRTNMGRRARTAVLNDFERTTVWRAYESKYESLLRQRRSEVPVNHTR